RLHSEISVAMREIDLDPSAGEPPVRAYDTSGPYSDPAVETDINRGLPELRKPWILAHGDVEFYAGREIKPEDNGLRRGEASGVSLFDRGRRRDHPEQHQPPGNRADGHRPQLPGQGQRQYRQLDRHLLGRRGGRED